ncbi:MAG: hypothetical protein Q4C70_06340 [Planctomycetia bacterium]|nr:hypothetical protein [Planctomycetia bacterium]
MYISKIVLFLMWILTVSGTVFAQEMSPEMEAVNSSETETGPVEVSAEIALAAEYITENTDRNGRVIYERSLNSHVYLNPTRYNILRHAGTIYAAYLYEMACESDSEAWREMHATRIRLSEYILKNYLHEVTVKTKNPGAKMETETETETETGAEVEFDSEADEKAESSVMMSVESKPEEESLPETQAKLGASGLALIGMSNLLPEGRIEPEILRGLGDFVLFMQREDGSFHSKYLYSTGEYDAKFHSSYYPGEAALGLLYLYDVDPQEKWLQGAKKALFFLAESRKDQEIVREFDHWAMLATEKLFRMPENGLSQEERAQLVFHARQMAFKALPTQILVGEPHEIGSMGGNISPCSNGTKMEGLISVYHILEGTGEDELRAEILTALDRLAGFLARAQVQEPFLRGGLPSSAGWRIPGVPKKACIVRIDNVQHVLSAWVRYRQIPRD